MRSFLFRNIYPTKGKRYFVVWDGGRTPRSYTWTEAQAEIAHRQRTYGGEYRAVEA